MSFAPLIGPAVSILGGLFGGSKSPAPSVVPGSETSKAIPDWLLPLYQQSANFLQQNLGKTFGYPGQLQVGMSPLSQQAYSDIGSLAGITPFAGGELSADISGAYADPTQNPITRNMVAMLNNQYGPNSLNTQDALRILHGHFNPASAASGAQGYSGAASAEGSLLGKLQTDLSSQVAQLLQNIYSQERGIQSNATSQALNVPASMQNLGNVPSAMQRENITAQQNDWMNQLKQMFAVPGAVFPAIQSAFSYPQTYQPTYGPSPLSSIGSGFTSLANSPAFNAMFPPGSPDTTGTGGNFTPPSGGTTPTSPVIYPGTNVGVPGFNE